MNKLYKKKLIIFLFFLLPNTLLASERVTIRPDLGTDYMSRYSYCELKLEQAMSIGVFSEFKINVNHDPSIVERISINSDFYEASWSNQKYFVELINCLLTAGYRDGRCTNFSIHENPYSNKLAATYQNCKYYRIGMP